MNIRSIDDWEARIQSIETELTEVARSLESMAVERESLLRAAAGGDAQGEAALVNHSQRCHGLVARQEHLGDLLVAAKLELKDAKARRPQVEQHNKRLQTAEDEAVQACDAFESAHTAMRNALERMNAKVAAVGAMAAVTDSSHPLSASGFKRRVQEWFVMASPIPVRPPFSDGGTGTRSPRSLSEQIRGQAAKHQEVA